MDVVAPVGAEGGGFDGARMPYQPPTLAARLSVEDQYAVCAVVGERGDQTPVAVQGLYRVSTRSKLESMSHCFRKLR